MFMQFFFNCNVWLVYWVKLMVSKAGFFLVIFQFLNTKNRASSFQERLTPYDIK